MGFRVLGSGFRVWGLGFREDTIIGSRVNNVVSLVIVASVRSPSKNPAKRAEGTGFRA